MRNSGRMKTRVYAVISLERHDACDYKMEVGTYLEKGEKFSGEECPLRGRLTFAEEVNTKLKQTLDIRNRCKVKLKNIHTKYVEVSNDSCSSCQLPNFELNSGLGE